MLVVIVLRVLPVPVGLRSAAAKGCMFAVAVFPNRTRVLPGFDWPVVRGGVTLILWKAPTLAFRLPPLLCRRLPKTDRRQGKCHDHE